MTIFDKELLLNKRMVVEVKTKKQDKKIREWAHSEGLEWSSGDSYIDVTYFDKSKGSCFYSFSTGRYFYNSDNDVETYSLIIISYKQAKQVENIDMYAGSFEDFLNFAMSRMDKESKDLSNE